MLGEVADPRELEAMRLPLPSGGDIPLHEVADIMDTTEELRENSTYQGQPSITLAVRKRSDGNTLVVAEGVQTAMAELKRDLPSGITMEVITESASFVAASVNDVLVNIALASP